MASGRQLLLVWSSGGTENEPEQLGVEEENGGSDNPGDDRGEPRICEFAHLGTVASKSDQRNHRERQLKTENHLTENEQRRNFVLAGKTDDQGGRNDRDRTCDEPAKPRLEPNVQKAFHHDLARQRAGQRGVLARCQQSAGEERAGEACPKYRAEKL